MKVAVLLDSPLREVFSLIGIQYVYPTDTYPEHLEKLEEDIALVILPRELEMVFKKRYPEKTIIGV